jgi:hypothetical protein
VASLTRPGRGYDIRAAKSRRFFAEAFRSIGTH